MCGICGRYYFKSSRPVDSSLLGKMMDALRHRGPDDHGMFVDGSLGLGFRRLSIIDIEGGHQPMTNERGDVWVVFNGEIYNYPDLKVALEVKGHVFTSKSDTEVIVHGYEQWGDEILNKLNGMFGLALWDRSRERLMIARDRLGVKIVYYQLDCDGLNFASEIRALLECISGKGVVDPLALYQFLRFRYTPSPKTILRGVNKLAPGTKLIVERGNVRVERWWQSHPVRLRPAPSFAEASARLALLYEDAVTRHLLSDVPVGLLLSGGIDSALLLALMKKAGYSPLTFSVGYGRQYKNDELHLAAQTGHLLGAVNIPVQIDHATFIRDLPRVVNILEEPIASASIVPMYHVCRRASEELKVAFVGQGPDELMAGYRRHLGVHYGRYWRRLPVGVRYWLKRMISKLPRSEVLKRGLYSLDVSERNKRYLQVFSLLEHSKISSLFRSDMLPNDSETSILESWSELLPELDLTDELGGLQYLELRASLPDELLMYTDKMSMAHSLELRVPYLDYTIVEYVESLPDKFKVRFFKGKRLHRVICQQYLDPRILKRRKRGFAADVVDAWYRESQDERTRDTIEASNSPLYEFLMPEAVRQLLIDHRSGAANNYKLLFSLSVFGEWLRQLN